MSYTIETLDEGQIIIATFQENADLERDMPLQMEEALALVDAAPGNAVLITDSRQIRLTKLEDVVKAANRARTPESRRLTQHPKLIKTITVTSSRLGLLAIKGLNTAAFGHLEIGIVETLEEAIEQARRLLAEA